MGSSLEDAGMVKDERESGKLVIDECNSQNGERKWGRAGEKASQNSVKCLRKRVPFHHDRLLENKIMSLSKYFIQFI
jgi:hypothetical protein